MLRCRNLARRLWLALARDEGFTLMELMIVVTIIAILAAGGFVAYGAFIQRAVDGVATSMAGTLATAVRMLEIEANASLAEKSAADIVDALQDYVEGPLTVKAPSYTVPDPPGATDPQPLSTNAAWLKCPANDETKWTLWVSRNNRLGTASFDGHMPPETADCQ